MFCPDPIHDLADQAPALLERLATAERDCREAEDALRRKGYRKSCDIPICNCGDTWQHGGHANERLRELGDALREHTNGKTLLQVVQELVERLVMADRHNALLRAVAEAVIAHENAVLASLRREREELVTLVDAAVECRHNEFSMCISDPPCQACNACRYQAVLTALLARPSAADQEEQ